MTQRRFVVLDRDGTILVERRYLSRLDQVELLPGAAAGLRKFRDLGLGMIVVTNQSAVGRGMFDLDQLARIHGRMEGLLAAEGIHLDGIYACPHLPDGGCGCRKPLPGLLETAARELEFEPCRSFVIGDKECDIELGRAVGAATLLVRTGYGAELAAAGLTADHVVDDLLGAAAAIERLLANPPRQGP